VWCNESDINSLLVELENLWLETNSTLVVSTFTNPFVLVGWKLRNKRNKIADILNSRGMSLYPLCVIGMQLPCSSLGIVLLKIN
jgi:hypothetical protein